MNERTNERIVRNKCECNYSLGHGQMDNVHGRSAGRKVIKNNQQQPATTTQIIYCENKKKETMNLN